MNEIKCAECGHENDSTRVFCHNCGIRLERPEGEKATIAETTPVMGRSSGPVRRGFFPVGGASGLILGLVRSLISLAILAAVLAVLIEAGREPDWVPPAATPDKQKATRLYQSIREFSDTVYPRTIDLTQEQANNYLGTRLEASEEGGALVQAKFIRAFVTIESDVMRFVVEQEYLGLPVYISVVLAPEITTNAATGHNEVSLRLAGSEIGRLALPALLAPLLQKYLQGVIDSTDAEMKFLSLADSLVFLPGVARLSWNGSQTPGG